jgi:hypothetical protein
MPNSKQILYEQRKQIIAETSKSSEEYERRIRELIKELRI